MTTILLIFGTSGHGLNSEYYFKRDIPTYNLKSCFYILIFRKLPDGVEQHMCAKLLMIWISFERIIFNFSISFFSFPGTQNTAKDLTDICNYYQWQ